MSPELITLLGGSALLVYSIEELSRNVQYLAGSRFRVWINTFAENRLSGILLGVVLSVLLTSSGAVTVILVGLASARLLSLEQVFSVTLGASIGTTFIVQLFAFGISDYGLFFFAMGVFVSSVARSDRFYHGARSLMFLGLMFFSMGMVVQSGKLMEQSEIFQYTINYFRDRPIVSLLISSSLTALVHSSAATIAFVMSLMVARNGTLIEAIPWVLGANLGTTATAYFASFKSGILGKQAALGNLLTKLVGVAICYPLMPYFAELVQWMAGNDVSRQIAHAHTFFNVALAVLFFPFIPWGVKVVRRWVPDKEGDGAFTFQYLDPRSLGTPELALAQSQREILRLSDIVEQMVDKSIHLFEGASQREIESLKEMDQVADFLNKGIKLYLTKLSQTEMTPEQVQREFDLLLRTNDLENMGDIVDKNIVELVRKNIKKGYAFSKEGWTEISEFHVKIVEILRLSTAYFNSRDPALLGRLQAQHQHIQDLMIDCTEKHIQRLHRAVKESMDTTSVHLDLLGNLQRIADLAVNCVKVRGWKPELDMK